MRPLVPEPRFPGVFVDEVSWPAEPISAVPLSSIGMVGLTERGPVDHPTLVTSFAAFQRTFGGDLAHENADRNHLAHAVRGAFDMGAKRIFVTRILGQHARFAEAVLPGLPFGVRALHPGQWGNRLRITVAPAEDGNLAGFSVTVALADPAGSVVQSETFDHLALNPAHPGFAPSSLDQSELVRLVARAVDPVPGIAGMSVDLAGGDDDLASIDDESYIGQPASQTRPATGLQTLSLVDEIGVVAIPGQAGHRVQAAMIAHCEEMRFRVAILDSAPSATAGEVLAQRQLYDSSSAALYYPWLLVHDRSHPGMGPVAIPPSGHVCGAIAQTDIDRGVHKAAANIALRSIVGVQTKVTKAGQDRLNPFGINVIRDFTAEGRGIRIWGARTLSSDPEAKYVPVRRLEFLVRKSIERGLTFAVFEPHSAALWTRIKRMVENFLQQLWREGVLAGTTAVEAYFVDVGPTTMTQADMDAGRLILLVGYSPLKPAEFVVCRIALKSADS
jgi:uncharacterized protein